MKNLQDQLNQYASLVKAAESSNITHNQLLYGVRRHRVPHLLLPGGHIAVLPEAAKTYAESLNK